MIVSNEKFTRWKLLQQKGDARKITELAGGKYKQITIYKALQHGHASMAVQDVIDQYFNEKARQLKEMASQL
jgi:hypothetical protein